MVLYGGSAELGAEITVLGAGLFGSPEATLDFNAMASLEAFTNVIDRVISLDGGGGLLAYDFDDGSLSRNTLLEGGAYDAFGKLVNGDGISGRGRSILSWECWYRSTESLLISLAMTLPSVVTQAPHADVAD